MILSFPEDGAAIQIEKSIMQEKNLLEIHIDYKLKFDTHEEIISKNAHRKFNFLSRITNYMELVKRRILINVFFKSMNGVEE